MFSTNKIWYKILAFVLFLLLLGGAKSPYRRDLSDRFLEGKISRTLDKGIWKLWEEEPVYQEITLDLICH
ncbi:hypothetical protein H1P_2430011 [Hyella patelloides LEGE 07179]|uniref:Uncharacterized protein n=1 Tax=Hyella patelloides LEGE 07179 TaxID=945734 RepID=A0A563VRU3_9CYAN|nr:hypothetical protein [Hyella patelloides]VEP14135.1 hypothetical protein H1P_2430011 [Hyella patelloides LEGE 07179]